MTGAWLRRRGALLASTATALVAAGSFPLHYAREARMYAVLALLGVITAAAASRWLEGGGRRWAVVAAASTTVALLTHASGLLLAAGLLALPGLRRDREAWWWRLSIVAGVAVWAVAWGPAFVDQARRPPSWIPFATPATIAEAVNGTVDLYDRLAIPVLIGIVAGGWLLVRNHPRLGRVWLCGFALPVSLAAAAGIHHHVLLPRTLAVCAWGPALAFGALVEGAWQRRTTLGLAAMAALAVVVLPSAWTQVTGSTTDTTAAIEHLALVARPGDAVAVRPAFLAPLTHWYLGVRRPGPEHPIVLGALRADAFVLGPGPWHGRVWLLDPVAYGAPPPPGRRCAPTFEADHHRVWCLDLGDQTRVPSAREI